MSTEDHEKVSIYPFSDDRKEELLSKAGECTFNWTTKDGWAVGVIHAFVWAKGSGWITCGVHRHRVSAIKRDPRCSVVVSGAAAPTGPNGAITFKGRAIIHDDRETKDWFYPALARGPYVRTGGGELSEEEEAAAQDFVRRLDSPLRVVIEIVPEKWIMLDSEKMGKDSIGELSDEERGPELEADAVRMKAELDKRGMD